MMHDMYQRGLRLVSAVILSTAFMASCLSLALQIPVLLRDYGAAPSMMTLFCLNMVGILAVALAVQPWKLSHRVFRIAAFAGAVSYPLYLLHQHAGYMLLDRLSPKFGHWPAFAIALVAVLCVAAATSELIEKPIRPWIVGRLARLTETARQIFMLSRPANFGKTKLPR